MACCVCMAIVFGAVAMTKTLLGWTPRGSNRQLAQEWRLTDRKDGDD